MVGTIGLAGCEEDCRGFVRKCSLLSIHLAGSIGGGAALGLMLGWSSGLAMAVEPTSTAVLLVPICAAYALSGLSLARLPQPSTGRQVPISWRRLPPPVLALHYGVPLGAGVFTRIFDGTVYAVLAGVVLTGDAVIGCVTLGAFGFGRGLFVFLAAGFGVRARDDVTPLVQAIAAHRTHARAAAGMALAAAAGFFALVGWTGTFTAPGW